MRPAPPVDTMLAAIPLKGFDAAKGRLAGLLDRDARAALSRELAARVAAACAEAGAAVVVVTSDPAVAAWARARGLEVLAEPPGGGLNGAAASAAAAAAGQGRSWTIVHADLPFLTPGVVAACAARVVPGAVVLAPSRQGGTNLLGAMEPLAFSYGPASFERHLAAARHLERRVIVTLGTALDLDTPEDLRAAAEQRGGAWLRAYLT